MFRGAGARAELGTLRVGLGSSGQAFQGEAPRPGLRKGGSGEEIGDRARYEE